MDPDPHLNTVRDPEPETQMNADPWGSGSATPFLHFFLLKR